MTDSATPQIYQDSHGHIKQGKKTFIKAEQYSGGPELNMAIENERDPAKQRVIRRSLAYAFSAKALQTQMDVMGKYLDMRVEQVKRKQDAPLGIGVDEVFQTLYLR